MKAHNQKVLNFDRDMCAIESSLGYSMSPTRLTIYGLLCIAAVIFLTGWLRGSSMMGTLLAEALGILVTVFIVDKLIASETKKARRPAAAAAYREAVRLFRQVEDVVWAASVSSIPSLLVTRVEEEESTTTQPWLVDYLSRLDPAQDGNQAQFIDGQFVARQWGTLLYDHRRTTEKLVSKYLERHAVTGDQDITAAIYDLETNGLFRELDKGPALFSNRQRAAAGWSDFLSKVEALRSVLMKHSHEYPEITEPMPLFGWSKMANELSAKNKLALIERNFVSAKVNSPAIVQKAVAEPQL